MNMLTSLSFYNMHIQQPTPHSPIPTHVYNDSKFYPYFKDVIGCLDGSHIPAHTRESDCPAYQNRKGFISQNVLAGCDFDLKFMYILSGWEGSVSDSELYAHA